MTPVELVGGPADGQHLHVEADKSFVRIAILPGPPTLTAKPGAKVTVREAEYRDTFRVSDGGRRLFAFARAW